MPKENRMKYKVIPYPSNDKKNNCRKYKIIPYPCIKCESSICCGKCKLECPICLEDISSSNVVVTECSHTFHAKCLKQSLKSKKECPNCRMNLSLDVENIVSRINSLMFVINKESTAYKLFLVKILHDFADRNNPNAQYELGCLYIMELFSNKII